MDLFARVSAVKASFHILHDSTPGKTADNVRQWARYTSATIMSHVPVDEDTYSEEDEDGAEV